MSLMHFIVITVREKFGDVKNFDADMRHMEKAATGASIYIWNYYSAIALNFNLYVGWI